MTLVIANIGANSVLKHVLKCSVIAFHFVVELLWILQLAPTKVCQLYAQNNGLNVMEIEYGIVG